jgi:pimeloyl-ACP methyl ester carboxylesterase
MLIAALLANSSVLAEQVTITDWRGQDLITTAGSVQSGDVEIAFHTAGTGPLVVMVHSITGPWFDFRNQMVALSQTHRVVAMSTRGTDQSGKPVGHEHYTSAKIADDINAIIDHFEEDRAVIVGQDSGGLHGWYFAMTNSQRTRALISLGSPHPAALIRELANNASQQQASGFQKWMQENPDAGKRFGQNLLNQTPAEGENSDIVAMRRAAFERLDPQSIVGFYKANWPVSPVTMDTEGFGFKFGNFPSVTAPTLFIYGKDNPVFVVELLNDMWRWVDGPLTTVVLPGVGHSLHTQAPQIVTPTIVQWLDGL